MNEPWRRALLVEAMEWRAEMMCARRHPELKTWNGYVAIGPDHPAFGLHYDDKALEHISVHGGLTFAADHIPHEKPVGLWWFGFDCAHAGDFIPGLPNPKRLGGEFRDLDYVREQMLALARQLARMRRPTS